MSNMPNNMPTNMPTNMIEVFDTTLRDGLQVEGVSASVEDKLRIAEQLDYLGVHYIEGGWLAPTRKTSNSLLAPQPN